MRLHPRFSYLSVPNVAETMLLMPLYLASFHLASLAFRVLGDVLHGGHEAESDTSTNPIGGGRFEFAATCVAELSSCSSDGLLEMVAAQAAAPMATPLLLRLLPPLVRAFLQLAAMLLAVLIAEMACDVARNTLSRARRHERLPGIGFWSRVTAAAESSCVITALEMGRLAGQWSRGGSGLLPLRQVDYDSDGNGGGNGNNGVSNGGNGGGGIAGNFCRRFDWHCGRLPGAVEHETKRSLWKLSVSHALLAVLMLTWTSIERGVGARF